MSGYVASHICPVTISLSHIWGGFCKDDQSFIHRKFEDSDIKSVINMQQ
jgi:hypothetical protein